MNYICSENHRYTYGTMSEITVDGGAQLWQLVSESGRGMVTGTASGPLRTGAAYAPGVAPEPMLLGRGYTGHEHLLWFGLVNMNARLYDPALGRFLSPDPEVQQPEGTQGFNRYTYCLNNPLRYVDLDGKKYYRYEDSRIARLLTSELAEEIRSTLQELESITDNARKSYLNDRIQEMYKCLNIDKAQPDLSKP